MHLLARCEPSGSCTNRHDRYLARPGNYSLHIVLTGSHVRMHRKYTPFVLAPVTATTATPQPPLLHMHAPPQCMMFALGLDLISINSLWFGVCDVRSLRQAGGNLFENTIS